MEAISCAEALDALIWNDQIVAMISPVMKRALQRNRRWWRPLWLAGHLWLERDCIDLSAAFAYFTLQSFFPALLIVLSICSSLLGRSQELTGHILDQVALVLPPANMPAFESILQRFMRQGFGAGLLGAGLLVVTGNNIYLTLLRGADRLTRSLEVQEERLSVRQLVMRFVALRIKAFTLLVLAALLLLMDQFFSNIRVFGFQFLHRLLLQLLPRSFHWMASISVGIDAIVSLVTAFSVSLLYLWLLPSRRIHPRYLLAPALLVGSAILLLNLGLGRLIVTLGERFQAYGVVGGVLILTLWIWLVGVVLYYGQCLGVVLSRRTLPGGRSALPHQLHS